VEFAAFQLAVYDWFSKQSGIQTIWQQESGPRPPRPYATLRLNTGQVKIGGQDNLRQDPTTGVYSLNGPRRITVACNIYGDGALERLTKVRDSLDDPAVIDQLDASGIAVEDDGEPQNITEALESHFEDRALMDVIFLVQADRTTGATSVAKISLNGKDIDS
jgi:hypothetical protein